ncbi:MAG: YkgJ family cysteine cluster protein [Chitinophagaceae bacterium]
MQAVNLRSFKQLVRNNRRKLRRFLTKIENNPPRGYNQLTVTVDKEVWKEVDCLSCANCCKTMTPTFTKADIKRIAAHFQQTPEAFTEQWLYKDRGGDMMNKKQPCQFLNLKDNKCSIYAIRPIDCSGFPHLTKSNIKDYAHVHKQNVEYCPATYKMVEKMKAILENRG